MRGEFVLKLKTRILNDLQPELGSGNTTTKNNIKADYIVGADDTNIDITNLNNINRKLITYNNIATRYDYITRWGELIS